MVFDSAIAMGEALTLHFPVSIGSGLPSETRWQFSDPESVPAFVFADEKA